jgi:hypothetical protein
LQDEIYHTFRIFTPIDIVSDEYEAIFRRVPLYGINEPLEHFQATMDIADNEGFPLPHRMTFA